MLATLTPPGRARSPLDRWMVFLVLLPAVGVVAIAAYAWASAGWAAFAAGLLTAAAALAVGAALGFLFAIPRSVSSSQPGVGWFKSSTSLEEISDWLTKILVGLSLVELGKLLHDTSRLVNFIGPALAPVPYRNAVTLGILALYSVSGFLIFYLATRVHIAPAFASTEEQL